MRLHYGHVCPEFALNSPLVLRNQNIADSHPDLAAGPATTEGRGHFRWHCLGRRCGICSMGPFRFCCGENS